MTKPDDSSKEQSLITAKLKSLYESIQNEAIPDRFIDMLEKLEEAERRADSKHAQDGQRAEGS